MTYLSKRIEDLAQRHYEKYHLVPNTVRMSTVLYNAFKLESAIRMEVMSYKPHLGPLTKLPAIMKYQSYFCLLDIIVVDTPNEFMEVSREWSSEAYEKERENREEEQRKKRFLEDYIESAKSFGINMKDARIEGNTIHATVEVPVTPAMVKMYEDGISMKE